MLAVFLFSTFGVRLSPVTSVRGVRISPMGARPATVRTTDLAVLGLLGLFNHLTIYPFNNLKFISLFSISIVKDYAI